MFKNYFTENIILPLKDLLLGDETYKNLKFLNKSQFWTREEIDNYQNTKLKELIKHSFDNVPFYHELFLDLRLKPEDIQTKNDLHKIPIITKDDLKKNKSKHLAKNISPKQLILASSSGSTGEPFQYYKTKYSESFLKACLIRSWSWMGYRLGDKYVKISMNDRSSFMKKMQDKMNSCLYLSSKQLSPNDFDKIKDDINNFDPLFIRCYPVPLLFLAQQIKNTDREYRGKSLKAINSTGSTLLSEVRKEIEDVFKVKIFDAYSCEGGSIFTQCPAHIYYHPSEEYAISEFLKDEYTNVDKDNAVRHITTDLHNYASPLIRYDTQDYLVLGDNKTCSCGRHFVNVKSIKGRDSDILKTPSGKYLIVENFVAYFEWIQEVDQIQIIQEELNLIKMKLLVNSAFDKNVFDKIYNYWSEYIGKDVKIEIEIVDEIKVGENGKRRTVIRNPKISLND